MMALSRSVEALCVRAAKILAAMPPNVRVTAFKITPEESRQLHSQLPIGSYDQFGLREGHYIYGIPVKVAE